MKITKNYITLLRYTSAMDKKCSLEMSANKQVKNFKQMTLKYMGATEYKTLPITTPTEININNRYNLYYDSFEAGSLAAQKSLSSIYDSWFTIIEP